MTPDTMGREPLTIVELDQPRCALRFGSGFDYRNWTPVLTKAQGDDIQNNELTRSVSVFAEIDLDFAENPHGTIWEQGGSGVGLWIGAAHGLLFLRAGNGAARPVSNAAFAEAPLERVSGLQGARLIVRVSKETNTASLTVLNAADAMVVSAHGAAESPLADWAGSNQGAIGIALSIPSDGTTEDPWNSTIRSAKFYQGAEVSAEPGCFSLADRPCYNTQGTCSFLQNYTPSGSIKWRFVDGRPGSYDFADYSDPDNPETDPFPCLVSVSTSENEINAGSNLDGRSPLGVTGKVSVQLEDFPYNDAAGDFYSPQRAGYEAGRPLPVRGNFWALWTARNQLFNGMYLRVYDGYAGQTLNDMRQRLYVLDKVDGPNGDGGVTLSGLDPLRLAGDKKAEFPRTSNLDLFGDIDDTQADVVIFGDERDLSDAFGNTGSRRYLVLGKELIEYTGYTGDGEGRFTLSGVVRGALGSEAQEHKDQDKVQRAGRYEGLKFWRVLNDLLVSHTEIPASFIPLAEWDLEGNTYLSTYTTTRTIVKPTAVVDLVGEITQQGLFYIWWSEYDQLIKMLAVRAPGSAPAVFTDETHLMRGTVLKRDPSIRITQVAIYYNEIDPFGGATDDKNYKNRFTAVDGENLGETRAKSIYAPWISNRTLAVQMSIRLLGRYKNVPEFLTFSVDAKDRGAVVGSVLDINTRSIVDAEGNVKTKRWQVISAKELVAGHTYLLSCQTYSFIGRFGRYMADGSPDWATATDDEKDIGSWYADSDGLLPDGTKGYQYQ